MMGWADRVNRFITWTPPPSIFTAAAITLLTHTDGTKDPKTWSSSNYFFLCTRPRKVFECSEKLGKIVKSAPIRWPTPRKISYQAAKFF